MATKKKAREMTREEALAVAADAARKLAAEQPAAIRDVLASDEHEVALIETLRRVGATSSGTSAPTLDVVFADLASIVDHVRGIRTIDPNLERQLTRALGRAWVGLGIGAREIADTLARDRMIEALHRQARWIIANGDNAASRLAAVTSVVSAIARMAPDTYARARKQTALINAALDGAIAIERHGRKPGRPPGANRRSFNSCVSELSREIFGRAIQPASLRTAQKRRRKKGAR